MKYKTNSPNYVTERISWPEWLPYKCISCDHPIQFHGSDNGKLIYCLTQTVNQVRNLYKCTNPDCIFSQKPFSPAVRFDFGSRSYGSDVLRYIADELLLGEARKKKIYNSLTHKYHLKISHRTVCRICDEILLLKAYKIDKETKAILAQNPKVLLGLDGQDPGKEGKALWLFLDYLNNRVLHTCLVDSLDYKKLHKILEKIKSEYNIEYIGFVSDKQNLITKCMKEYYPNLPHQYCQYHFLKNIWNHLETLDSNIFLPLKKAVNGLYIHTADPTKEVSFENVGKMSIRTAFQTIDKDFQKMTKARNKTFKRLRGTWFYETLTSYIDGMDARSKSLKPGYRFTINFNKTIQVLKEALENVSYLYEEAIYGINIFTRIRNTLKDTSRAWLEQQVECDEIFNEIWDEAKRRGLKTKPPELRSFLPKKNSLFKEILGEWCRLWTSYRPGLFQYCKFPLPIKTNNGCEQSFSGEKQILVRETGKGNVSHQIQTRGELYLRLAHCEEWELEEDINRQFSEVIIQTLQRHLQTKISEVTKNWKKYDEEYIGYEEAIDIFCPT